MTGPRSRELALVTAKEVRLGSLSKEALGAWLAAMWKVASVVTLPRLMVETLEVELGLWLEILWEKM
jgi:hypothetical protein